MREYIIMALLFINEYSQIILGVIYVAALKSFTTTFNDTKKFVVKVIVFLMLANALFWFGIFCVMFLNERYLLGNKVLLMGLKGIAEEIIVIVIFSMSLPLIGINILLKLFQGKTVTSMIYVFVFCLIYYLTFLASNYYFGLR